MECLIVPPCGYASINNCGSAVDGRGGTHLKVGTTDIDEDEVFSHRLRFEELAGLLSGDEVGLRHRRWEGRVPRCWLLLCGGHTKDGKLEGNWDFWGDVDVRLTILGGTRAFMQTGSSPDHNPDLIRVLRGWGSVVANARQRSYLTYKSGNDLAAPRVS